MHRCGVIFHRFLLHDAQDVQSGRFSAANMAHAMASGAGVVRGLAERGPQPLSRQLHQPKAGNLAHLDARPVIAQRVAQPCLHFALVAAAFHVDEVDHDESAQVAQP